MNIFELLMCIAILSAAGVLMGDVKKLEAEKKSLVNANAVMEMKIRSLTWEKGVDYVR